MEAGARGIPGCTVRIEYRLRLLRSHSASPLGPDVPGPRAGQCTAGAGRAWTTWVHRPGEWARPTERHPLACTPDQWVLHPGAWFQSWDAVFPEHPHPPETFLVQAPTSSLCTHPPASVKSSVSTRDPFHTCSSSPDQDKMGLSDSQEADGRKVLSPRPPGPWSLLTPPGTCLDIPTNAAHS